MDDPAPSATRWKNRARPVAASLLALAPGHLPNHREARYLGGDMCIALGRLAERDQALLRRLYGVLTELLSAIVDPATDDRRKWQDVALWLERYPSNPLIDEVRELGIASHDRRPSEELAKVVHDVRGGALSSLLGRLQMIELLPHREKELKTLFVLTRDHLKIMRNAVVGLDEPRRNADRRPKTHDMRLMLEKWHDSTVGPNWRERSVRMTIDCRYEGPLTECCMESAAIDRIFYNLAANAARHGAGDHLEMAVFPVPEPPGECLRFVLSNEVSEPQAAYLNGLIERGGADSVDRGRSASIFILFAPEVSSTGSGFGLAVVAEFVAAAFGLRSSQAALRERYVGAILDGRVFRVWFHWPMASTGLPRKLDDYRRPRESLSEP